MWSVARSRPSDGRVEFVKGLVPGGGIEVTLKAQQAMMFTSLVAAQSLAKELEGDWYTVGWKEATE